MLLLRDSIMHCPSCKAVSFDDPESSQTQGCWSCGGMLPKPRSITLGGARVILTDGTVLFPHHLDPSRRLDFSRELAVVARHPTEPALMGLRNLGDQPWRALMSSGQEVHVPGGRTVAVQPGSRISFGRIDGLVS
jgi:hypothetical protein